VSALLLSLFKAAPRAREQAAAPWISGTPSTCRLYSCFAHASCSHRCTALRRLAPALWNKNGQREKTNRPGAENADADDVHRNARRVHKYSDERDKNADHEERDQGPWNTDEAEVTQLRGRRGHAARIDGAKRQLTDERCHDSDHDHYVLGQEYEAKQHCADIEEIARNPQSDQQSVLADLLAGEETQDPAKPAVRSTPSHVT
jgi:hypothetical protein